MKAKEESLHSIKLSIEEAKQMQLATKVTLEARIVEKDSLKRVKTSKCEYAPVLNLTLQDDSG